MGRLAGRASHQAFQGGGKAGCLNTRARSFVARAMTRGAWPRPVAEPPLVLNLKCLHLALLFPLLITVAPVYRLLPVIQALCYGSSLRST